MSLSRIKSALAGLLFKVIPGIRYDETPRAESVDSIVAPLGKIMANLRRAQEQHAARSVAHEQAARRSAQQAELAAQESLRAARLAENIYAFIG